MHGPFIKKKKKKKIEFNLNLILLLHPHLCIRQYLNSKSSNYYSQQGESTNIQIPVNCIVNRNRRVVLKKNITFLEI